MLMVLQVQKAHSQRAYYVTMQLTTGHTVLPFYYPGS